MNPVARTAVIQAVEHVLRQREAYSSWSSISETAAMIVGELTALGCVAPEPIECGEPSALRCALERGHNGPHAPDRLVSELVADRRDARRRIGWLEAENERLRAGCVPPDELIEAARDVIAPAEDALRYLTCDDRRFGMDPPSYLLYREVWDALRDALTRLQAAALAAAPDGQDRP